MDVRIGGININTVPFCIIDSLNDKSPTRFSRPEFLLQVYFLHASGAEAG
jgi:hypothetical protein